jgi:hypothetical protein
MSALALYGGVRSVFHPRGKSVKCPLEIRLGELHSQHVVVEKRTIPAPDLPTHKQSLY